MILSFELPFALVPLIKFTSIKSKMGAHANSMAVKSFHRFFTNFNWKNCMLKFFFGSLHFSQISATTWIIGSLIMGINIHFLVNYLIESLLHNYLRFIGKVFCGILGFSAMLVYLVGIAYLVFRKNKEVSHLLALTMPEGREMTNSTGNSSVYSLPREDIVSMQLPKNRDTYDLDWGKHLAINLGR